MIHETETNLLPPGVRVKVLPPRDDETGKIIAEKAIKITGREGVVIAAVVHGRISVRLDIGGIFHLDPERVAALMKRAERDA